MINLDPKQLKIIELPSNFDNRGILTSIESSIDVPIEIRRIFYMHNISAERGGHAHIDTDQVLIAISGNFKVLVYNGNETNEYILDNPTIGLFIPRLFFINMIEFSPGAVCVVLANTHYNINMSLRNEEDYLNYINNKQS